MSIKLIDAAMKYARTRGAKIIEGYSVGPRKGSIPDAFVWMGVPAAFKKARFREVLRRSPTRPIMRRRLR